jgi:rhamnosyltransferase
MILGIIVTYNPDFEKFLLNVKSIICQVDYLLVFDNNSLNRDSFYKLNDFDRLGIFFSDSNIGLGSAYNYAVKNYQFDYLVTFDQDTLLSDNCISRLLVYFNDPKVGIVGPAFSHFNSSKSDVSQVTALIQSCSIFKYELFENIGLFNEAYFIDSIDFEYCLRTKIGGYSILCINNVFISHQLGDTKSFFGIFYSSHNNIRNFFIARNHVNLTIRFFKFFPQFIFRKNVFFILHFFKLCVLERDFKKIRFFVCGFIRGFS